MTLREAYLQGKQDFWDYISYDCPPPNIRYDPELLQSWQKGWNFALDKED